ncbi:MAG: hypothetical protein A3I66_11445 [Burkholderiales bacterium RIFCSPLOWO2_02_FULL_57_36]|nr:MAG: hypothetical protein A3I66_11445 [Burkholderiales bacterium RIFCSPLOWO2_02_FULL_57_36]
MTTYNFPPTSRYYGIETITKKFDGERMVTCLRRRFVPPPERFSLLQEHVVGEDERIDRVAATYLGDPQAFWRIADANTAMQPEHLTAEIGRRVRITLPEGVPGTPNAGLIDA